MTRLLIERTVAIKLKITYSGNITLQNPYAPIACTFLPGRNLSITIVIIDVPQALAMHELLRLAQGTIMLKLNNWMVAHPSEDYDDVPPEALTYDFSQLGIGRIAR